MTPIHLSVPHIQQQMPGECLAACAQMILTYLNDPAFSTAPIQVERDEFDLAWLDWDEKYVVVTSWA